MIILVPGDGSQLLPYSPKTWFPPPEHHGNLYKTQMWCHTSVFTAFPWRNGSKAGESGGSPQASCWNVCAAETREVTVKTSSWKLFSDLFICTVTRAYAHTHTHMCAQTCTLRAHTRVHTHKTKSKEDAGMPIFNSVSYFEFWHRRLSFFF